MALEFTFMKTAKTAKTAHDVPSNVAVIGSGSTCTVTDIQVALPKPQVLVETMTETEAMVSELVDLYKRYEEADMKKICARIEALKKSLQSIANETMDADAVAVLKSPNGEVEFSPRGEATVVSDTNGLLTYLENKLGLEASLSCVKIGIGDLKKLVAAHEMKPFVELVPGSRTMKAVRYTEAA